MMTLNDKRSFLKSNKEIKQQRSKNNFKKYVGVKIINMEAAQAIKR